MKTIEHDDMVAIQNLFVGRKIVKADKDVSTMTLDNGVILEIEPNEGNAYNCGYMLENITSFENVIMDAKVVAVEGDLSDRAYGDDSKMVYSLFVYAAGVENGQAVAIIEGNDGSGFYGTGFKIHVKQG